MSPSEREAADGRVNFAYGYLGNGKQDITLGYPDKPKAQSTIQRGASRGRMRRPTGKTVARKVFAVRKEHER